MTTYDKVVKGATKIKVAAPKPKYIEPILLATSSKEDFRSVMKALRVRLDDPAWSIVYKALLVIHIMIREGEQDVTLKFLSSRPEFIDVRRIKGSGIGDLKCLARYARYLSVRAKEYDSTHIDYVKDEQKSNRKDGGALRQLTVEKGLLRQVESVEKQIRALLNCNFKEVDINDEIVLTCFRMLVNDLLCLYQALNEGVINILEHYFEMSKYDAERALEIYKEFVELTTDVVNYLRTAKHLEYATRLHVPTIRHAPTALAKSLEEYLNDVNFEVNRSQYLAERAYKNSSGSLPAQKTQSQSQAQPQAQAQPQTQMQPQATAQQIPASLAPQRTSTNPWAAQTFGPNGLQPLQVQFTQGLQPIAALQPHPTNNPFLTMQQPQVQPQVQQQPQGISSGFSTVPASTIVPSFTGAGFGGYSANPFMQQQTQQQAQQQVQPQQLQSQQTQQQTFPQSNVKQEQPAPKLVASKTGNNPFSLNFRSSTMSSIPEQQQPLKPQPTNNPFAATATADATRSTTFTGPITAQATGNNPFVKQYTSNRISMAGAPPSFGGLENLPTQPVFPQTIQEQRTGQFQQQAQFGLQQQLQAQHTQQMQLQQQQLQQQQQPLYSTYDGPSLI